MPRPPRWGTLLRAQYRHRIARTPGVRMVPGVLDVEGRRVRYAVSDNESAHGPGGPGSPPIWAVNIHGYFGGGGMYWRESARLAERTGWRVVNPSLPGFGGSDPLAPVTMAGLADHVRHVLRHLHAGPAVVLGHSMGGAVAVQYAHERPGEVLGIIYRGGVATPAWRTRQGPLAFLLGAGAPDAAALADLLGAMVLDVPDLLLGRLYSTVRAMLPDARRNLAAVGRVLPVGGLLMTVDLRREVEAVAARGVPILAEWGCFDRVVGGRTPAEFSRCARTPVQWLAGGHSWMLARPQGQAEVLTHLPSGRAFVTEVERRWRTGLHQPAV